MVSDGSDESDREEQDRDLGVFGYIAAIVLCCFIVGVLAYGLGRENERREQAPASYAQAAKVDAQRACVGREASATFECIYEKVEAAQEQARGEQDLTAQQIAANSALMNAIVAFFTLIITGVGAWLIRETLIATQKGVAGAESAATAAHSAVRETTRIGEAQVRAYIQVASVTVSITRTLLSINVTFKNTGQSPASEVTARFTPAVWLAGIGEPKIIEKVAHFAAEERSVDGGIIGSGAESHNAGTVWLFSPADHANFYLAEKFGATTKLMVAVLLSFHLTWLDVFGNEQTVFGVVNADDFGSDKFGGQDAITAEGKPRNEDFDVTKWAERKKRLAGRQ